jgi:hypothetical protein
VVSRDEIKISDRLIHPGSIFPALETHLISALRDSGYEINTERGLDTQCDGLVPRSVGAWTKEGIRVVAKLIDWKHDKAEFVTKLTVQLEQHS